MPRLVSRLHPWGATRLEEWTAERCSMKRYALAITLLLGCAADAVEGTDVANRALGNVQQVDQVRMTFPCLWTPTCKDRDGNVVLGDRPTSSCPEFPSQAADVRTPGY
jgi:hypothetical protein